MSLLTIVSCAVCRYSDSNSIVYISLVSAPNSPCSPMWVAWRTVLVNTDKNSIIFLKQSLFLSLQKGLTGFDTVDSNGVRVTQYWLVSGSIPIFDKCRIQNCSKLCLFNCIYHPVLHKVNLFNHKTVLWVCLLWKTFCSQNRMQH